MELQDKSSMYDEMDKRKKEYDYTNLINSNDNLTPEFKSARMGYIQNIQNEGDIGNNLAQAQNVSNALGLFSQPSALAQRLGVKPQERPDFTSPLKTLYDVQKQKTERYRQMMDLLNKVKPTQIKSTIVTAPSLHNEIITKAEALKKAGNPQYKFWENEAQRVKGMTDQQATAYRNIYDQDLRQAATLESKESSDIANRDLRIQKMRVDMSQRLDTKLEKFKNREMNIGMASGIVNKELAKISNTSDNTQHSDPNGFLELVRGNLMKAMGEVGAISDSDIKRLGGSQKITDRINRFINKTFITGNNFTTKDLKDLKEFTDTMAEIVLRHKDAETLEYANKYFEFAGFNNPQDYFRVLSPMGNYNNAMVAYNDWNKKTDIDLAAIANTAPQNKDYDGYLKDKGITVTRGLANEQAVLPQQNKPQNINNKIDMLNGFNSVLQELKGSMTNVNNPKIK